MLVDCWARFGWWVDGWIGVKLDLRDCLAQSQKSMENLFKDKFFYFLSKKANYRHFLQPIY
jgi:hypothetical protein